jgi:hypothetical protein
MADRHEDRPDMPRRPAGRRTLGGGLAMALAVAGLGAPLSAEAAPPAAPKPVLSSNLDQIQNQFATDAAAARAKFDKVAVQFTAVADTVEATAAGDLNIGFHTRQHPKPIRAVFTKAAAQAHGAAKPGDLVQARCDQVAEAAGTLELRGCVFR